MPTQRHDHKSLFAEIQTLSGVGSFDWNLTTNELHWSEHLFRIYGLEPQSGPINLQHFLSRIHPDDRSAVEEAIRVALHETGSLHGEERILRADGTVRILESNGIVLRDDTGAPVRFVGTCRDVTELRETEAALRWQIDGLALLSDVAKELLAKAATRDDWDRLLSRLASHLKCDVFTNYRVDGAHMTLQSHGGLNAACVHMLSHITVGSYLCGHFAETAQFGYLSASELHENPRGEELWDHGIRAYVCAPLIDSGKVIGTLSFASSVRNSFTQPELDFVRTASDVIGAAHARRRADEDLTASEARCQLVIQHAKIVIWESDPLMDRFSYVTGSCEAVLGFTDTEWQTPGFWARQIHADDRVAAVAACRRAANERQDYRQEYRMVSANLDTIWVEHVAKVMVNNDAVVGIRGALVDITDRKLLEGQYLQAQKMEAVGTLTGGIAHDFNNFLAAIIANLESALHTAKQRVAGSEPAIELKFVDAALEASRGASATVRQLLTFSRKDGSDFRPTDCNHVLNSATQLLSHALGSSIKMRLDLRQQLPPVLGNSSQLEQVIYNLCANARDAMPAGGEIVLRTELESHDQREMIVIRVLDNGVGMTEQTRLRIFEPFFTTKDVDLGTGLGLAMCYAVVIQHGGEIYCESQLGEGTQFEIRLPCMMAAENERTVVAHVPETDCSVSGGLKILVVDDEEVVRTAVSALLGSHGVSVMQASNGDEALSIIRSLPLGSIDAVLLDRTMPGLDGWEILQEIDRIRPALPVVLCSGYLWDEQRRTGFAKPAAILQKPFSFAELTRVLHDILPALREPTPS